MDVRQQHASRNVPPATHATTLYQSSLFYSSHTSNLISHPQGVKLLRIKNDNWGNWLSCGTTTGYSYLILPSRGHISPLFMLLISVDEDSMKLQTHPYYIFSLSDFPGQIHPKLLCEDHNIVQHLHD